jgi:hypothetical protein
MLARRSNAAAAVPTKKKTCFQHAFLCPTPDCCKSSKYLIVVYFTYTLVDLQKSARFQTSKNHRWAKAVVQPRPVEHHESLTDYPGMMQTQLTSRMRLSMATLRTTIMVLVHPTTKQVSILNLPTMQL